MSDPQPDYERIRGYFELIAGRSLTVAEELRAEARRLLRQADRIASMGEVARSCVESLPEPEPEEPQPIRRPNPPQLTPAQRAQQFVDPPSSGTEHTGWTPRLAGGESA